jgi:pimeloyl-ACP methyl ester carboxylesterase
MAGARALLGEAFRCGGVALSLAAVGWALGAAAWPLRAQGAAGAAGYWEGSIQLPATALGVRVELEERPGRSWGGTISIPVQGLRNFALTNVTVRGNEVGFAMPGIPGEPTFTGQLAADKQTLAGDFTQGGQTFKFKLERKAVRPPQGAETPARGIPGQGLAGIWQGSLRVSVAELRLLLKLTNAPNAKLAGAIDSLDQGARDIPIDSVEFATNRVQLELKRIGGGFDGSLSADGSEIAGEWKQGGQSLPLVFKRIEKAPELRRPQEPRRPYPYREEEVEVQNRKAGIKLGGTLTWPGEGGPFPAVFLITGSGAQDRDEALMGHRPFLVLADHLTRAGIAVLRVDDRGVGKSTGDLAKCTVEDFVDDAVAAVEFLKGRREVDARRIGLLGHSEGGTVAPLAAVREPGIAFIVLLAGVGVPMDQLLVRQAADIARVMGGSEEIIARNGDTQRRIFEIIRGEPDAAAAERRIRALVAEQVKALTDTQRSALGLSDAAIEGQIKLATSPWLRHFLGYDPKATLMKVKCPVLAINGEKDLQVAAKVNLGAMREALEAGGNRAVETVEFPNLNHLFQTCQTGAVAEYGQIEETMAPVALETIGKWIRRQTGR